MAGKLDEISLAIGSLKAEVAAQTAAGTAAAESRARIYEKVEEIGKNLADLSARVETMEPTVAEISKWRERGVGAVMLISFAAASVGGLLATYGKKLLTVFDPG